MSGDGGNSKFWRDSFGRHFSYVPGTMRPKTDIWLEYFSVDDVILWAEFLSKPIPAILKRFERANKQLGEPLV